MNNDLISRSALKKAIDEIFDTVEVVLFDDIIAIIDNAPTVETYTKDDMTREYLKGYNACKDMNERPQGEWVGNAFDEHYCNRCGHPALWEEEPDDYYENLSDFCPNCGADMRKGGANEKNNILCNNW